MHETFLAFFGILAALAASATLCITLTINAHNNDHRQTIENEHNNEVKIACIDKGWTWENGNCFYLPAGGK